MPEYHVRLAGNDRAAALKAVARKKKTAAFREITGGVTASEGFVAGSLWCGIKAENAEKHDLALILSTEPCVAAATFTTNKVTAAPVEISQQHITSGDVRAIIANSGNANACTGARGLRDAIAMTTATAKALGLERRQVLVCSTGRIGVDLPMTKIAKSIARLPATLSREGSLAAARAIMTSDTFPKETALEFPLDGKRVRIGGIAKGAGMIDPTMATMLCFVTTDAAITPRDLERALSAAVEQSFNRITIDGDMSTNDTAIILANGAAGNRPVRRTTEGWEVFQRALNEVTLRLAHMIVEDGEGVTKFVNVHVKNAASPADARAAANAVAKSCLVKCAWFGGDPNWGRIMDALGYAPIALRQDRIDIAYDGVSAVRQGQASRTSFARLQEVAARARFTITIDLHLGDADYMVYTTDLSMRYVELNMGE